MFATLAGMSVGDLPIAQLLLKFKPTANFFVKARFLKDLQVASNPDDAPFGQFPYIFGQVVQTTDSDSGNSKVVKILNKVFDTIIVLTMFLCFFALSANMSANLYTQTKEIGVLRSIGFTKMRIKFLYFYESMVLVLASCLMGVLIGMMVGYTMCLQQSLILHGDLTVYFPWTQFVVIMAISFVCAFASTFGPTTQLTSKSISAIFRMI